MILKIQINYHISLFMNDGNEVSATITNICRKNGLIILPLLRQLDPNQKGIINLEVGSLF